MSNAEQVFFQRDSLVTAEDSILPFTVESDHLGDYLVSRINAFKLPKLQIMGSRAMSELPYLVSSTNSNEISMHLLQELVEAAKLDAKDVYFEIGSGRKLSPVETAASYPNTVVVAADFSNKPGSYYCLPKDYSNVSPESGSFSAFFPLDVSMIPDFPVFDRVQLISPPPISPELIYREATRFLSPDGELVVAFDRKWDKESVQHVVDLLVESGLSVDHKRIFSRSLFSRIGVATSNYIQRNSIMERISLVTAG